MKAQLEAIRGTALEAIHAAANAAELDTVRVQYLGKKGELTAVLKQMGKLSPEERPVMGQMANEVRAALEGAIESQSAILAASSPKGRARSTAIQRKRKRRTASSLILLDLCRSNDSSGTQEE